MGIVPRKVTAPCANDTLPSSCTVTGNKKSELCRHGKDRECIIRECNRRQGGIEKRGDANSLSTTSAAFLCGISRRNA